MMASDATIAILNKRLAELTAQVASVVEELRKLREEDDRAGNHGSAKS